MTPFRITKLRGESAMAAKKSAAKKKVKVLAHFDYLINIVTDSAGKKFVQIVGKNGGTIRGKGGEWVRYSRGKDVQGFKIVCTVLPDNSQNTAEEAWPFQGDEPDPEKWLSSFCRKLIKPEKGAPLLIFKYTISVANAEPADPAIIIDEM
jgi:hypothetical protein